VHLILSSCDFRNDTSRKCIIDNLNISIDECRLLFIPNEKATYEAIHSEKYYCRMQEFGFRRENTHVFDYFSPDEYGSLKIDAIFISGGNTFQTLDRLRKCGFDKAIIKYVKSGATYIGGSAGAHIATKNIEHVMQYDNNSTDMTNFDGLGLFDGILICHYTDERKAHFEKLLSEGKFKAYALTNEDSVVVDN
jgi:peptidase E